MLSILRGYDLGMNSALLTISVVSHDLIHCIGCVNILAFNGIAFHNCKHD